MWEIESFSLTLHPNNKFERYARRKSPKNCSIKKHGICFKIAIMPVDKQVLLRYQVLNRCFRNKYREYTIDDLVDECNKQGALHKNTKNAPKWEKCF